MFVKETYAWTLKDKIGRACGTWGREEELVQGLVEKPDRR
jgi:hypothetical protein